MSWNVEFVSALLTVFVTFSPKFSLAQCPPLNNTESVLVSCEFEGDEVECSNAAAGTVATFECAPSYKNVYLALNPYSLCVNGAWTARVPECVFTPGPVKKDKPCGVIATRRFKGRDETVFPWSISLYQRKTRGNESNIQLTCGGTLIADNVFLSVASCFINTLNGSNLVVNSDPEHYLAGCGVLYRSYKHPKDQEIAQYRKIKSISLHEDYQEMLVYRKGDFAIVTVEESFVFSRYIRPVCISWQDTNEEFWDRKFDIIVPGILYDKYNQSTNAPATIQVPHITPEECMKEMPESLRTNITPDKICAVLSNSSSDNCHTLSGYGLTFKNPNNNKFYLIGLVSVSPSKMDDDYSCSRNVIAMFTKIFQYSNRISALIKHQTSLHNLYENVCGIKSVQAQMLIVDGKTVSQGDYPWQVAIYKPNLSGVKQLICGGSLISRRAIVTAAHCVTNSKGEIFPREVFTLYAGKYFRNLIDERDTEAQLALVQKIFVPSLYQGETQNFVADVAVIITDRNFVFTRRIQSICVDWDILYENRLLRSGNRGFVSGWGYTSENGAPSEVLKDIQVPFVEKNQCEKDLPVDYKIYLTYDKLCSGFLNQSTGVCKGDSGGGLVFRNEVDGRYYLVGIVSLSPQAPDGGCDSRQYALYTKIYPYVKHFIFESIKHFL